MKKQDWKALVLVSLSTGILISAQASNKAKSTDSQNSVSQDANEGNMNYHLMTEEELLMELTPEGAAMYKSLSPEGKKMALKTASMMCNSSNPCKGLNACKDDKHDCAGKGDCSGKGVCAFSDKNLAVKVVRDKMAAKRDGLRQGS